MKMDNVLLLLVLFLYDDVVFCHQGTVLLSMSAPFTVATSFSATTYRCLVTVTMATASWRVKRLGGWVLIDMTG